MNRVISIVFAALSGVVVSAFAAEVPSVKGTVNADVLNLRLKPGLDQPVVGRVLEKSEVAITKVVGNWLEIKAPANLKVYVAEYKIGRSGRVSGELNMRVAMSAKAPILGVLSDGMMVKKIGEPRNGWVQIEVPAESDIRVYAASFLVTYDTSAFDKNGNVAVIQPVETPAAPVAEKTVEVEKPAAPVAEKTVEVEKPAAPVAEKTVEVEKPVAPVAEKTVEVEKPAAPADTVELQGVVSRWKYSTSKESEFVLLSEPNGLNLAFIFSDDSSKLSAVENKQVKISGKNAGRFGNNGVVIVKVDTVEVL